MIIKIYINDKNQGFPVLNSKMEDTAIAWASNSYYGKKDREYRVIEVDNLFNQIEIYDIDSRDCTGGNAWKIYAVINNEKISFDLREQHLLDILKHSSVSNGIIQCPLVVIDRGAFVMLNGSYYNEYLQKENYKQNKKIANKDLKFGHLYDSLTDKSVYLGTTKRDNKTQLIFASLWTYNKTLMLKLKGSHSYKEDKGNVEDIREYIDNSIKDAEKTIESYKTKDPYWHIHSTKYYEDKIALYQEIKDKNGL